MGGILFTDPSADRWENAGLKGSNSFHGPRSFVSIENTCRRPAPQSDAMCYRLPRASSMVAPVKHERPRLSSNVARRGARLHSPVHTPDRVAVMIMKI
jgi:hypothetical protein